MFSTVLFILILVLGVATLFWMILKNSTEKIAAQYAALGEKFGLELNVPKPSMGGFVRPEPSLYGRHQGREVSVSVPGKGLQNTRQIETVLKLELKERTLAAQLTGSGLLGGFRQRDGRGMDRWKSGNEAFDAAVDARSNHTHLLDRALGPDLQQTLAEILKKGKGSLYIGGGVIAYAELGLIADDAVRERFESVLECLQQLAEVIESYSLKSGLERARCRAPLRSESTDRSSKASARRRIATGMKGGLLPLVNGCPANQG